MKKSEAFPTRFLSAGDLKGKAVTVTVASIKREMLKGPKGGEEREKTVLYFVGKTKGLPVNQVNWDAIAEIAGDDDSDGWVGVKFELFPTKTRMGGDLVDCVRVRSAQQSDLKLQKAKPEAVPPPPVTPNDMDDEIPF